MLLLILADADVRSFHNLTMLRIDAVGDQGEVWVVGFRRVEVRVIVPENFELRFGVVCDSPPYPTATRHHGHRLKLVESWRTPMRDYFCPRHRGHDHQRRFAPPSIFVFAGENLMPPPPKTNHSLSKSPGENGYPDDRS